MAGLVAPATRQVLKSKPPTRTTLRKYILSLVEYMKQEVRRALPEKFVLIFDDWGVQCYHYLVVFAVFINDGEIQAPLLGCAPLVALGEEKPFAAEQHL